MFGGVFDVMKKPEGEKSQARQHRDWPHERHTREIGMLQNIEAVLKNMFFPINNGIEEAFFELMMLRRSIDNGECFLDHLEYHFRDRMVKRIKEVETPV